MDNGYVVVGKSYSFGNAGQCYVIRTEPDPAVSVLEQDSKIPKVFSLSQNYPNPSSPQTTIQYGLPKESRVTLKVYNVLGQEIRVLVDKFQGAGAYSVVWDIRDNAGRRVSCGTYFLRLEAEDYTATMKLSVMR